MIVSRVAAALTIALALLAGCAQADAGAIPRLEREKGGDNVAALVRMIDRLCVVSSNDNDRFAQAIAATGWPFTKVQEADAQTSLGIWRVPEAELIHSERPLTPAGGEVWVCSLKVSAAFAPDPAALQAALSERFGAPRGDVTDPITWEWRPTRLQYATMTLNPVSAANGGGVLVFVELGQPAS